MKDVNKNLCRGKRIDNGQWVYGLYFYSSQTGATSIIVQGQKNASMVRVKPDTVSRFVLLNDMNKRPIFEGDIVDASKAWWDAPGQAGHDSPIIEVKWMEDRTGFDPFANYDCDFGVYIEAQDCKVIGNRWDNPELLKGSDSYDKG